MQFLYKDQGSDPCGVFEMQLATVDCSNAHRIPPISSRQEPAKASPGWVGNALPSGKISLNDFNELVLAYQDAAYNFAFYLLGDPDLAEDVTQNAFISAYKNYHQFQGSSFRSWLFKIIKNASYDEFRRPSYRKNTSLDGLEEDTGARWLHDNSTDPEDALATTEQSAFIRQALDQVEDPYRTILIMVDVQEMDYQEAARVTNIPVGTVKSRLARARQQFRKIASRLGYE